MSGLRNGHKLAVVGVCLLAFFLRILLLDKQSLWWDEAANIIAAQAPLEQIATHPRLDIHPPLYFYLLHFWLILAGSSEFAARYFSVAFGVLQIPLLYQLGASLFDKRVGLMAAGLIALSTPMIHEAQEVRMYTLLVAITILGSIFVWRVAKRNRFGDWIGYMLMSATGIYVHYSYAFILLFQNLFLVGLVFWRRKREPGFGLRWVASQSLVALVLAPQIPRILNQAGSYTNPDLIPPDLWSLVRQLWMGFVTDLTIEPKEVGIFLTLAAVLAAAGSLDVLWRGIRDAIYRQTTLFTLAWALVPITAYWMILQSKPFVHPRYVLVALPAVVLVLALGVEVVNRAHRLFGAVGFMALLLAYSLGTYSYFFNPQFFRDDVRGVMAYLAKEGTAQDVIIATEAPYPYQYYYSGTAALEFVEVSPQSVGENLTSAARGKERLFLIQWFLNNADPWGILSFLLGKYGEALGQETFRNYSVVAYRLPPETTFEVAENWDAADIQFEEKLILEAVADGGHGLDGTSSREEANAAQTPVGQPAWVALRWLTVADTAEDYSVTVILQDRNGHLLAQSDVALRNSQRLKTSHWTLGEETESLHLLPVPLGTPPGEYQLLVAVYEGESLRRLGAYSSAGNFLGAVVPIGTVDVIRPSQSAAPEILPIQNELTQDFGALRLLGYNLLPGPVYPGSTLSLGLWWQATEEPRVDYEVRLQVVDEVGKLLGETYGWPVNGTYPTTQWIKGEIVQDWYDLRLSPEASPGEIHLWLRVWDSRSDALVGEVQLTTVLVQPGRPRLWEPPQVESPLEVRFGDNILLLGYHLPSTQVRPGENLTVTFYWQALGSSEGNYTVFTHLLDQGNKIWGQVDSQPQGGRAPTAEWVPGEYLVDEYLIPVDLDAPPGEYWLELGMYDPDTGKRLPILSLRGEALGDHLLGGPVQVMKP